MTPEIRAFIEGPANPGVEMNDDLRAGAAEVMRCWLAEAQECGQLPMILIVAEPGNSKEPFGVLPGPGLSNQEVADVLAFITRAMQAGNVVNVEPRA